MLIDELNELNTALYKACGELKENRGHINKAEHQDIIEDNLFELYKLDYKLIRGKFEEEEKRAAELEIKKTVRDNEFERRKKQLQPKRKRLWYTLWLMRRPNRAEELLERETEANTDMFLNNKERAIEELEKIIEAADNEPCEALKPITRRERREQRRQERKERKLEKRQRK